MKVQTLYDLVAPVYGKLMPSMSSRLTARASQRVQAGAPDSILEIGMGPGHLIRELESKTSAHIVGVDLSKRMVVEARRKPAHRAHPTRFVCADGLQLPFRRGAFDSVVSVFLFDVLGPEMVPLMLREMGRVLTPGGRVVVGTLHITNALIRKSWMLAYRVLPDLVGKARPATIDAHIEAAGFRVLKEEEIDEFAGARLITLVNVVG